MREIATDDDGLVRLQKLLAQSGVASRRKCEELMLAGVVVVDGEVVTRLGTKVDPRTAVVVYDVPAGRPDCIRRPKASVDRETADAVHVSVTYELGRMDCTSTRHDQISVSSRAELRDRDIVVNGESWAPAPTAAYRRCADDTCTPPVPPQCTNQGVTGALDVIEADGNRRTRTCTSRWLVFDVDGRRWFFEYRDKSWHPLLGTRNPGCASVRDVTPEFPAGICEKLPQPA